ncbi:MAG: hypothetical protein RMA76_12370 [Deltaproteobacteria bacterium]
MSKVFRAGPFNIGAHLDPLPRGEGLATEHLAADGALRAAVSAYELTLAPTAAMQWRATVLDAKAGQMRETFAAAPDASVTGIHPGDASHFADVAKQSGHFIIVRDSNPASLAYRKDPDALPKPMELKAKTARTGPHAGLVVCAPDDYPTASAHAAAVAKLEGLGFTIGDAEDGHLVRDAAGHCFHADYDLHGLYEGVLPEHLTTERLMYALNRRFGKAMIQHPPHDRWCDRNVPGPNQGPRPPAVAFLTDGTAVHLETVDDIHTFYEIARVDWDALYPDA